MPRATNAPSSRRRRNRTIKQAKGYWGARKNLYRTAREAVERAGAYAYRDRRLRKRDFRRLWISRINAAARKNGLSYSRFMDGLKKAEVHVNRKALADIAVNDSEAFARLVDVAKSHLTK